MCVCAVDCDSVLMCNCFVSVVAGVVCKVEKKSKVVKVSKVVFSFAGNVAVVAVVVVDVAAAAIVVVVVEGVDDITTIHVFAPLRD